MDPPAPRPPLPCCAGGATCPGLPCLAGLLAALGALRGSATCSSVQASNSHTWGWHMHAAVAAHTLKHLLRYAPWQKVLMHAAYCTGRLLMSHTYPAPPHTGRLPRKRTYCAGVAEVQPAWCLQESHLSCGGAQRCATNAHGAACCSSPVG
jgi:hypothetical protein